MENRYLYEINEISKSIVELNKQKYVMIKDEIDVIIRNNIKNERNIERVLDEMLDILSFYKTEETLLTFKKLCRYYFNINPQATVDYINIYRKYNEQEECYEK